jgi:hypothetical protein
VISFAARLTTRRGLLTVGMLAIVSGVGSAPATAAAATLAPSWQIMSVARPTSFAQSDTAVCQELGPIQCDRYSVIVTNAGGRATEGPVTITDTLPAQLKLVGLEQVTTEVFSETEDLAEFVESELGHARVKCSEPTVGTLNCTYGEKGEGLSPGSELAFSVPVEVTTGETGLADNKVAIEGGGAARATTSQPSTTPNIVNGATPGFGIQDFHFSAIPFGGGEDNRAGDHPGAITTGVDFNSAFYAELAPHNADLTGAFPAGGEVKDIAVELPAGFVGNPQAAVTCSETTVSAAGPEELNFEDLEHEFGRTITHCPPGSVVGAVTVEPSNPFQIIATDKKFGFTTPLYNVATDGGYPAEFGFSFLGHAVFLFASVIPTQNGYRLRVASPGIAKLGVKGVQLTLYGEPNSHDQTGGRPAALFRNPTACSGEPLTAKVEADSWQAPGHWVSTPEETVAYPGVTDCNLLQFEPTIEVSPETTQADTPSGYDVTLSVPQTPDVFPNLATPDLRRATVSLAAGVALSPAGANGLDACSESQIGLLDTEVGADGLVHATQGHCPAGSRVGTVEVDTPLLRERLKGSLYVAQPQCGGAGQPACTEQSASDGELFGVYLEIAGAGVIVKLHGKVDVDSSSGRVTTTFDNGPQLPFDELKLHLHGGPRAPLANPQSCGAAETTTDLAPWSGPPDASPFALFNVDANGNGSACPAVPAFAPTLSAGSVSADAAQSSPFTLTLSRHDQEQGLADVAVTMPPGLLGSLSKVHLCGAADAAAGTCGADSLIGHAHAAAGAGEQPLWRTGSVYLTGPYASGPFGLSIVTAAQVGPFNLGNVIVRASIKVDPLTSALTVSSDPLPRIIDGVPLRIQIINVTVDRPGFMLNPTNCAQHPIAAVVTGSLPNGGPGATIPLSSPFAALGCNRLAFSPRFSASTQGHTSKLDGASLEVRVAATQGQANIAKVRAVLPVQLPSRLKTLQQACDASVFERNPHSCPSGSVVGSARAVTPILTSPLSGSAYLVSHGGAAFPDLVLLLQGEGVTIELVGNTSIKHGVTTSTFNALPDAPVTSFDLKLPAGRGAILGAVLPAKAKGSLCSSHLRMPLTITGQNGAVVTQSTKIAVTGCPIHHKVRRHKLRRRRSHGLNRQRSHGHARSRNGRRHP